MAPYRYEFKATQMVDPLVVGLLVHWSLTLWSPSTTWPPLRAASVAARRQHI